MSQRIPQKISLTFDDILLRPAASTIMPAHAKVTTSLTRNISLNIPLISAAMDTVTESTMAIAMAQAGGIGVIHRNMTSEQQAEMVRRVKKFESGIVYEPVTITPEKTLNEALELMRSSKISGIPVCQSGPHKKLLGILTHRDVRFATEYDMPVKNLMTSQNLVTIKDGTSFEEAKRILHQHRIEKLIVVDDDYQCIGLMTVKDIERSRLHPDAAKDKKGRLRVGASIGTGAEHLKRAEQLINEEVDVLVLDTAHGHSCYVLESLKTLKKHFAHVDIIAGNVATAEATRYLIDEGADAVKVGIGPGSICTTRIVAGVGVPQLSAILECAEEANRHNIPIIADGGIRQSGDLAKALASGAYVSMVGSLLAGTDETPGEVFLLNGRSYKSYRGMGSSGAMARGSADRYFQQDVKDMIKMIPEGVEGQVPYRGNVASVLHQLIGGLKASMGYTGCKTLSEFRQKTTFVRISSSALSENYVHGVDMTREPPNYSPF